MMEALVGLVVPVGQSTSDGGSNPAYIVLALLLMGVVVFYVAARARRQREARLTDLDVEESFEPSDLGEGATMAHLYVEGLNGQIEVDDE
jgi:hypothetical protein